MEEDEGKEEVERERKRRKRWLHVLSGIISRPKTIKY